jgi:hypothetical protein
VEILNFALHSQLVLFIFPVQSVAAATTAKLFEL